ncbi:hypothetical protein ACKWTF_016613 [Chironomus riparius]
MSINNLCILLTILTLQINGNKIIDPITTESAQIAQVIVDLARNFNKKFNEQFDLIQYGRFSMEICNEIAKIFPNIILKKLLIETKGIPVKNPTIVVCRKFSDILSLTLNMHLINSFTKQIIILVYCEEIGRFNGFHNFYINSLMNFHIHPILYVLNHFGDTIELKTLEMCIPIISCNSRNWETINIFNKSSNAWSQFPNIPKKHQNLNGNVIELGLFPNSPINRFKLINNDTKVVVSGIASDIARIVAEKYNFTIYFQPFAPPKEATGRKGYAFEAVRINGVERMPTIFLDIVRVIGGHKFMATGEFGYCMTQPFMNLNKYFIVTPGDLYTSYEKLTWPFDYTTWVFIASNFLAAFLVIFIINRLDRKFQAILYGQNIRYASLNVVSTFFGISMTKLPTKNFARFILIIFILYCLIIRTAYQGVLFDILSSDHRQPTINDYDEVLLQNYTLYKRNHDQVGEGFVEQLLVNKTPVVVYAHLIGSDTEIHKIFATQCQNASAKMFISLTSEHLHMYNEATQQICPWHTIQYPRENYAAFGRYPANHFFFKMLNNILDTIIPTGIVDYIVHQNFEIRYYVDNKIGDPVSMTLNDLGFGFIVWMCSLFPTILVFLVELLDWIWKCQKNTNFKRVKFAKVFSEGSTSLSRNKISKPNGN